jgi:acyl-CoA synthetase (NDP forming)
MSGRASGNLRAFFEPISIAAIGSLREVPGTAYWLIRNLREFGYSDPIYPINPDTTKYTEVLGSPVCESVAAVSESIDLAVAIAPPSSMPEIVEQCADKGVPALVILSEGFSESGAEGAELQRRVTEIAREGGVRIMGPNTFGVVNTANGLATIAPYLDPQRMESGGVAVCSQTGSTGPHQMPLEDWGYPISKMCDIGNKCDVDEVDLLDYLADDPQTRVVAMHLEDVRDGRRFMEAARRLVARKPLVILKTGRTQAGARALVSHTGSLMGSDHVYDGAFRQVGALRVATWQQFWEVPRTLLSEPLPRGKRFAVITITGGQGVIAADAAVAAGLEVASFSAETIERLSAVSPRLGGNPVDLGPAMSDSRSQSSGNPFAIVGEAASLVLGDARVDCATVTLCVGRQMVPMFPMLMEMFDEVARKAAKAMNVWVYGTSLQAVEEAVRQLQARGIAAHSDLDVAIHSLGHAARYSAARIGPARVASTATPTSEDPELV